jgi:sialate O-acetylesterase
MADRFSVSTMFTNNMVLQRNGHDPIWGWAQPGDMITVHFAGHTVVTRTGPSGRWQIDLSPLAASSAPRTMTISDGKQAIALHDVVVGEVWLCSGQSNMQYPMAGWFHRTNLARALAAAHHPTIRLYHVPMIESMFAGRPHLTAPAKWQRCTPGTAAGFSAVAYFFGNALRKRLHVPIGLIESDWGGTSIEAWTPAVGFFKYSHLTKTQRWLKTAMAREADLAGAPAGVHRRGLINSPHGYPYDFQSTWLPDPHQNPTTLFNGMISPLIPFAIRGVIWYQGENNVLSHDTHYYSQLKALILGWRHVWNQGPFPFYIVQIAPFNYGQNWCGPHGTDAPYEPLIWQAEEKAATHVAHVGIVGTMDIGPGAKQIFDHHVNNIHPANKQAVGYRLARLALVKTYGFEGMPCEGPTFQSASLQNHRIVIHFAHSDGGLISRNGKPLSWFQIAGSNGRFLPANARIVGRSVVVVTNAIQHPKAVRFAFNCVAVPNLANRAGLPAMPFEVQLKR